MKKRFLSFLLTVIMIFSLSTVSFAQSTVDEETKRELIRYILFTAMNYSKDDIDSTELFLDTLMKFAGEDDEKFNEVLRNFTESIDEYGEYYSEEEVNELTTDLTGVSGGIGATVEMANGILRVVNVLPDSAAEKAGVGTGWRINKVDGESMEGKSLYGALSYVRGDIGTEVEIEFITPEKKAVTLTLVRGQIDVASVSHSVIENTKDVNDKIGYIVIENFSATTGTELKEVLSEYKKDKIEKIILDLRYNGGGVLEGALEVASCFLPKGKVIVTIEPKNEKESEVYKSTGSVYDGDIVVLVNEYSASASEVVTGALKDHKRATVVGVRTFGKATVQTINPLPLYGGLFKFTTAHYVTPNGERINKYGLIPDFTIPIEEYQLQPYEVEEPKMERKFDVGDAGEDVKLIKDYLTKIGYRLSENDVYDEETKEVVSIFQKEKGLYPYGICDFTTQKKIREALLEETFYNDTQLEKAIQLLNK